MEGLINLMGGYDYKVVESMIRRYAHRHENPIEVKEAIRIAEKLGYNDLVVELKSDFEIA